MREINTDFLIVGAGIVGLAIAKAIAEKFPSKNIIIIDKETSVGMHSSGRNSGVLHAGFYYTADSLKAKFTKEGNEELTQFCEANNLKINKCGKVVVARNEEELKSLFELKKRGDINNVPLKVIDEKELKEIEPNAKTYKYALWSPITSTVDPSEVCRKLQERLNKKGVKIFFHTPYKRKLTGNAVVAGDKVFHFEKLINAAGLYADRIAKDFGFSENYVIIPFKGVYLEYTGKDKPVKTNIYPVPNLKNPFLGVHYTVKVDGKIKIGPTAIPAFWRENYSWVKNFSLWEFLQIISWESKLFFSNAFGFRDLALEEMKKYSKKYLQKLAEYMVEGVNVKNFSKWGKAGIRAQLLNVRNKELVMDFVVEGDKESVHILNAVSPAFTASFPFARWVVNKFIL